MACIYHTQSLHSYECLHMHYAPILNMLCSESIAHLTLSERKDHCNISRLHHFHQAEHLCDGAWSAEVYHLLVGVLLVCDVDKISLGSFS